MPRCPGCPLFLASWLLAAGLAAAGLFSPDSTGTAPQAGARVPADQDGDPLPADALARLGTVRWRHEDRVQALAFAPDGKLLASAGNDFTIRLWDTATGKEIRRFGPPGGRANPYAPARSVACVAFTPDGKALAAGLGDRTVRIWEVSTGRELYRLQGHQGAIRAVAFAADGKTVASGSVDQTIRLWDTAGRRLIRQLAGRDTITSLAFTPDGRTLVSGGADGFVRIWQVADGREVRSIEAHPGEVHAVAVSRDGRSLASAGAGGAVRLWDLRPAGNLPGDSVLGAGIPWNRTPNLATVAQGIVFLRRYGGPRLLTGHQGDVEALGFTPNGKDLLSGGQDRTIRSWDASSGRQRWQGAGRPGPVLCLAVSPDGHTVASGDGFSTIRLWEAASGREIGPDRGHQGPVDYVAFSPPGRTLVTASPDETVRVWEPATGRELRRWVGQQASGRAVALSPDGTLVIVGGADGMVRLCDRASGRELRRLATGRSAITCVSLAPDGRLLATGGADHTVRLWDSTTGQSIEQLQGAEKPLARVVLSPDGKMVAAGTQDDPIYLWQVGTGAPPRLLGETGAEVDALAFSPDGRLLAAGSRDGTVRLWDVAAGSYTRQLTGHPGYVLALAFAADGKTLAAGSWRSVRLWETATGNERGRLDKQPGDALAVAFSPDGRTLAVGNRGTSVLVWDVTGHRHPGRLPITHLSAQELEALWTDLASTDAARAYRTIWSLVAAPGQSVPFLGARLRPVPLPDAFQQKRIPQLLAELDSENFAVREKANRELEQQGEAAEPALRRALAAGPAVEVRSRLEKLMARLQEPARLRERIRQIRAHEALEKIGTWEARQVLERLAQGSPAAAVTQDAQAALARLARRQAAAP